MDREASRHMIKRALLAANPVTFLASALVALVVGCSGATASDVEGDLPEDFDTEAVTLVAEPEPGDPESANDDAAESKDERGDRGDHDGDHDGDDDGHKKSKKHKKKHRHHHLFKKLDRLDGNKNGEIVIAALPTDRVPAHVIEKLHAIDTNRDNIVTREESHDYCKSMHHDWH